MIFASVAINVQSVLLVVCTSSATRCEHTTHPTHPATWRCSWPGTIQPQCPAAFSEPRIQYSFRHHHHFLVYRYSCSCSREGQVHLSAHFLGASMTTMAPHLSRRRPVSARASSTPTHTHTNTHTTDTDTDTHTHSFALRCMWWRVSVCVCTRCSLSGAASPLKAINQSTNTQRTDR